MCLIHYKRDKRFRIKISKNYVLAKMLLEVYLTGKNTVINK